VNVNDEISCMIFNLIKVKVQVLALGDYEIFETKGISNMLLI
jgi:hypothetical protein